MSKPTISILIPTHQRERRFQRALKSALDQKYHNKEIICSNDGTPYEIEVPKSVMMFNKPSEGPSANYEHLLRVSSGKYVIFLDDDDYFIHDGVIDQYVQKIERRNGKLAAIMGDYVILHQTVKLKERYWRQSAASFLIDVYNDTNDFQLSQVMFNRDTITDYDFDYLRDLPENDIAMFQWALCKPKSQVDFINGFTYVLTVNGDNMTWGKDIKYSKKWLDLIEMEMANQKVPKMRSWRKEMEKNHVFQ